MPFPSSSVDLMATAMGGPLLAASSGTNLTAPNAVGSSSPSSASSATKSKKEASTTSTNATMRIFYSLKDNPNAIISYTDLVRKEHKRQQRMTEQQTQAQKNSGNTSIAPNASTQSVPLKNQKVTGTGPDTLSGSNTKDTAITQSSFTAMDIDPPEGEEALGEGDSEAEDDDEADEDEDDNDNDEDEEAEDEDDDEDDDEDEDDDPNGRREPKSFLDALTEKYVRQDENGNEGEDEDEDEDDDGKSIVQKRPSRWDTEHYDIEDEFIDDSEMMLEAIGMVRPKVEGFFAYRGPVETTTEDPDSSDAGPRSRKPAKRKTATGSSPLNTSRSGVSKSAKGSSLAVMESANDSTSEMSEMDDKPKPAKAAAGGSGLANSSTPADGFAAPAGLEGGSSSLITTPTKKKSAPTKGKAAAKDITKEAESNKDSDKESKSGATKKSKAKPSKAAAASTSTAIASSTTPIVRVDSPPPGDDGVDNAENAGAADAVTPPPASVPSRSASPTKSKSKSKATAGAESGSSAAVTAVNSEDVAAAHGTLEAGASATPAKPVSKSSAGEGSSKSKSSKTLEPMNEEVQAAYDVVAELAKKGWIADLEAQKTRLIEQFTTRTDMVWRASGLAEQEKNQPEKDGDGDVNMGSEDGKPQKRFPWSQDLRLLLWETMEKFMEILAAKQEYRVIDESQPVPPSDSKTRKDAYQTLLPSFPAGWMTSYEISRQYSQLKEKVQKQEKREVESNNATVPIGKARPIFATNSGSRSGNTNVARSSTAQTSSTAAVDKKSVVGAPSSTAASASALNPTSTPKEQTLSVSSSVSSADTVKDKVQHTGASASTVHRTANLSEILHLSSHPGQQQQSPRTQNTSFAAGPGNAQSPSKKRKKPEEAQALGAGTSHDPVVFADVPPERKDEMHPQGYYMNGNATSSSPSKGVNQANYPVHQDTDATKKKKVTAVARNVGGPVSVGHAHTGAYLQGSREPLYQQQHPSPPAPLHSPAYSPPANVPHAQSQMPHSHNSRGYPSPHQHPQAPPQHHHYQHQHHDPMASQAHQRISSPGGGGGAYAAPSSVSPSRALPPPPPHPQTLGSQPSSAMSMSNLLHHPHPQQHSR
ncbi:hypothetical protein BGX28_006211 [Mortierella sp. GBA30]|nr:hypothetical protein BGX28_006211 [Mortierella sp. GBA30]